jgi:hypothetical protein
MLKGYHSAGDVALHLERGRLVWIVRGRSGENLIRAECSGPDGSSRWPRTSSRKLPQILDLPVLKRILAKVARVRRSTRGPPFRLYAAGGGPSGPASWRWPVA